MKPHILTSSLTLSLTLCLIGGTAWAQTPPSAKARPKPPVVNDTALRAKAAQHDEQLQARQRDVAQQHAQGVAALQALQAQAAAQITAQQAAPAKKVTK